MYGRSMLRPYRFFNFNGACLSGVPSGYELKIFNPDSFFIELRRAERCDGACTSAIQSAIRNPRSAMYTPLRFPSQEGNVLCLAVLNGEELRLGYQDRGDKPEVNHSPL